MRIAVIFMLLTLSSGYSVAQVYSQIGARSGGIGNTGLCLTDVWSVYNNPGAFGMLEKTSLGVSAENRFLLKQLSTQSLAFGYHTEKSGNFGLHFQQYGFNLYREMQGGLVYGMKLFENFSAGVTIDYHGVFLAENYGSKNTVSAGLGIHYAATKNLKFGMRVRNINRAKLADFNDERLPTYFGLGMLYQAGKKTFCTLEAEKDLSHPVNVKAGIEIQPHDIFSVRLGVNSYPFQSTFGFGLNLKNFLFDASAQWHTSLGMSPAFSIQYRFQ